MELSRACLIHNSNPTLINSCFITRFRLLTSKTSRFSRFVCIQEEQHVNQPSHSSNNAVCYIWCTCACWLKIHPATLVQSIMQFIITSPLGSVIINMFYLSLLHMQNSVHWLFFVSCSDSFFSFGCSSRGQLMYVAIVEQRASGQAILHCLTTRM